MQLSISEEIWPLKSVFRISRGAKTEARTVSVKLEDERGNIGFGECVPYGRYNETTLTVMAQIEAARGEIEKGVSIDELQNLMPAGAARNAVDCAMWDLLAKQSKKRIWDLAGIKIPSAVETFYTISLDSHEIMIATAKKANKYKKLKIKIGSDIDLDVIPLLHKARPDASFIIDANEALSIDGLKKLIAIGVDNNVELIEQPFKEGYDDALLHIASPIVICADESFHTFKDVEKTVAKYDAINIKLDKTGGFTEALKTIKEARIAGQKIMFGCMVGTSLVTAPAIVLASLCDWVDLDGPLLLKKDRPNGLSVNGAIIDQPSAQLWG